MVVSRPVPPLAKNKTHEKCPCGSLATHVLEWVTRAQRGGLATHRERRMCRRCAERAAFQLLAIHRHLTRVAARSI